MAGETGVVDVCVFKRPIRVRVTGTNGAAVSCFFKLGRTTQNFFMWFFIHLSHHLGGEVTHETSQMVRDWCRFRCNLCLRFVIDVPRAILGTSSRHLFRRPNYVALFCRRPVWRRTVLPFKFSAKKR